jgi:UPF0716 protein FxsA
MNPRFLFLTLLIGVPLLEIYLVAQIGSAIGAFSTVLLIVLMAIIGLMLVRAQGLTTLLRARASLRRGEVPAFELLEGAALLVSGALLLIPGFLTDAAAFVLLWPTSRRLILRGLKPRVRVVAHENPRRSRMLEDNAPNGRIIDGQYTRKPDQD